MVTLVDLANHTVEQLTRKGFTELMARRLLRAFDGYVLNLSEDKEIGEPEQPRTPFQVVRPNAILPTKAPTLMRRMENFGRIGVKRKPASSGSPSNQRHSAIIRLQSEPSPSISLMHLTGGKEETDSSRGEGEGGGGGGGGGVEGGGEGEERGGGGISDQHVLESHFLTAPRMLKRSQSVPTNLHMMSGERSLNRQSLTSLMMETPTGVPATSLTETIAALEEGGIGVENDMCLLYALLDVVKDDWRVWEEEVMASERGVSAVCRVLDQYSGYLEMVKLGCRVMRCIVCVSTDLTTPTIVNAAITVLDAITQHLHCHEVQFNGCLTLTNLCSAGRQPASFSSSSSTSSSSSSSTSSSSSSSSSS